jgi:hypothetical protein
MASQEVERKRQGEANMESPEFELFLDALRQGNQEAVRRLIQDYGPDIARVIRTRMARTGLRRVADSSDICQSVLFTFLQHAAKGRFVPETSAELAVLLRSTALNKPGEGTKQRFLQAAWNRAREDRQGSRCLAHAS